jgi:hypothetical protein
LPRLYVANVTQQTQQFTYWVPETPRSLVQEIPIGGQVQIATRDLPKEVIDSIIDQHRVYGICTYAEGMRDPNFSGIVYSVDRPVSLSNLYELANKRQQSIIQLGKRLREEAAIATDQAIVDVLQQSGMPARLQELEMSVEEKSRDPRDDSPEISEGVRVSRRTPEPNSTPRGRGRARAATRRASVVALLILLACPISGFADPLVTSSPQPVKLGEIKGDLRDDGMPCGVTLGGVVVCEDENYKGPSLLSGTMSVGSPTATGATSLTEICLSDNPPSICSRMPSK